jgi:hypothetical protein
MGTRRRAVEVLFELLGPVVGSLDEAAIRQMFLNVPSGTELVDLHHCAG